MVRLVELRSEAICAWQQTLPPGHRFEATQALRQVLNRAVAWELIEINPAKRGVDNPLRRFPEKRPFESWAEIEALAAKLGPVYGPMIVFAAATGLRPAELSRSTLFPAPRGGHVELHSFRHQHWRPAQLQPESTRSAARTTYATPMPPSRSALASRSSTSHGSWVRAWR